jgi:hypothetical protein
MSDRLINVRATVQGDEVGKWLSRKHWDPRKVTVGERIHIIGGPGVTRYSDRVDLLIRPHGDPKHSDNPSSFDLIRLALEALEESDLPSDCKIQIEVDR